MKKYLVILCLLSRNQILCGAAQSTVPTYYPSFKLNNAESDNESNNNASESNN